MPAESAMPAIQVQYTANVPVMVTRDDGAIVAYTPAFNVGSCGRTQAEAVRRLGEAITAFVADCAKAGTLHEALTELGWRPAKDNRFEAPRTSDHPAKIQRNIPTHILSRRNINVRIPAAA